MVQEQHKIEKGSNSTTKPIYEPTELRTFFLQVLSKQIGEAPIVNDSNAKVIDMLCAYLNKEPKFTEAGFSFQKGIWLAGHYGSGKTQLAMAYRTAKKILFQEIVGFKTCVEMNEAFLRVNALTNQHEGEKAIRTYANRLDDKERIFDDLGEEELTVNDYGNKTCVMARILSERYKGTPKVITHITTNLTREQVHKEYGGRIESRIYEMFNFLPLGKDQTEDLRKNR